MDRSRAGLVLGTLLFLGPMLAVRRLHAAAALVLSIGAGSRLRRALVRPTPGWRVGSRRIGAIAGLVEEVAEVVATVASSGYITGQTIHVNGGWYFT